MRFMAHDRCNIQFGMLHKSQKTLVTPRDSKTLKFPLCVKICEWECGMHFMTCCNIISLVTKTHHVPLLTEILCHTSKHVCKQLVVLWRSVCCWVAKGYTLDNTIV